LREGDAPVMFTATKGGRLIDTAAERIVIVGAGHAGGSVAAFLRQYGFDGPITIIGEEPIAPYQRPPLSKAWLKGEADAESLLLRPDSFYVENYIALRLDTRVEVIDRAAKTVVLKGGETLPYNKLILATGRRARRIALPGIDLDGVLELRTAADADRLKAALSPGKDGGPGKRLAVIGGGYIGLEAAASARALGAEAVVIEKEPRVLARVACEALSTFFQDYHRAKGVVFELGAGVERIEGGNGRAVGVRLSDGRLIAADAVLIGVGAVANDELASEAGLECENGVLVDLCAQTADPSVYAIGDCSRRPLPHYERIGHLESVPNALEQAKQAAADITGRAPPPHEVPWFWSDQYDLKLQIAGLPHDATQILIRGEPAPTPGSARFAVFHLTADNRVQAVEAINAAPEFMAGRQLIASRKPVAPDKLRDMSISMKEVAA
jgi:3-phenylpropionate/trans-cinnamate dioxygenase ferredoxin reductase subunit